MAVLLPRVPEPHTCVRALTLNATTKYPAQNHCHSIATRRHSDEVDGLRSESYSDACIHKRRARRNNQSRTLSRSTCRLCSLEIFLNSVFVLHKSPSHACTEVPKPTTLGDPTRDVIIRVCNTHMKIVIYRVSTIDTKTSNTLTHTLGHKDTQTLTLILTLAHNHTDTCTHADSQNEPLGGSVGSTLLIVLINFSQHGHTLQ